MEEMSAVDLTGPIPKNLLKEVKPIHGELMRARYIDSVARLESARSVLKVLSEYLEQRGIVGIHYTRAESASILAKGLVCTKGAERRRWFLETYGHHFTREERRSIERAWRAYFEPDQNAVRDSRIWFNLPKVEIDGGADPLLRHFGGETIYMPLVDLGTVADKIRSFGEPLVVKCRLVPSQLIGFWEFPAALVWLSGHHVRINPNAGLYGVDVYVTQDVPPSDILSVEKVELKSW